MRSLFARALLGALVVASPTAPAPDEPGAPPGARSVQISLAAVTPSVVTEDTGVALTGTLVNVGSSPVTVGRVRARVAYRGLDTRAAVTSWGDSSADLATTVEVGQDVIGTELDPGDRLPFTVVAPPGTIDPGFDLATLPLLVEAVGAGGGDDGAGQDGAAESVHGSLRSYLGFDGAPGAERTRIDLALLAPLTLPPDPDLAHPDDTVREEAWAEAIGPGSAVQDLLDGTADLPVTLLVDPAALTPPDPAPSLAQPALSDGDPGQDPAPEDGPVPSTPSAPVPEVEPTTGATSEPPTTPTTTPTTPDSTATSAPPSPPEDEGGSSSAPPPATGPDDGGVQEPGTGDDPQDEDDRDEDDRLAGELRERLEALPDARVWSLPRDDADLTALLQAGAAPPELAPLLDRGRATPPGATDALSLGRDDVAWPLAGDPDDDLVTDLRQTWALCQDADPLAAVVVPSSSVVTEDLLTGSAVWRHEEGPALLAHDQTLGAILDADAGPGREAETTQRLLAETLAIYQERPAVARSLLIALPRGSEVSPGTLAAAGAALGSAPWLEPVTVQALLVGADDPVTTTLGGRADPARAPGDATAYPPPSSSPITAAGLARVEEVREELHGVASVLALGPQLADTWDPALDGAVSARWRLGPDGWDRAAERAEDLVAEIVDGVQVNGSTINLFAEEGVFQLTVVNDLPVDVSGITVTVTPGNGRLQVIEQPGPLSVGAESRATLSFRARAVAAGEVPLDLAIVSPAGTTVGSTEELRVRVRPTGIWIYWLLGGAAGAILVLGLARALRPRPGSGQTRRGQRLTASAEEGQR